VLKTPVYSIYDSPHQFEPLLPSPENARLLEKAAEISRAATRLTGAAHASTRASVRELVRSMNSYYSNRIEGQGTHPLNIERALRKDFDAKPDVARLQRIALAHIDAERELEKRVEAGESPMASAFLLAAHHALYARLAEDDRTTEDGRIVAPGQVRTENVDVGKHVPPDHASLPRFMRTMDERYDRRMGWDRHLIAVACMHHRAAWMHPFLDGNRRAVRLQSHSALWQLSDGLWSPSRGLARRKEEYYARLSNADHHRRGDLDGRGNLTQAGLVEWVEFFLDVYADQVQFMTKMLDLDDMKRRIEALIIFKAAQVKPIRREAILPLHHLFAAGPLRRDEFSQLTGLGERTARSLLSALLKEQLLVSDTPKGPVRLGLPLNALLFLFPSLYPEAQTRPD
jgi:Fic family protein